MMQYFISDLHLSDKRPDLIRAFVHMTKEIIATRRNSELYILGDFYEAWIGDDFEADWNNDIEKALLDLSKSGINVYFLHGNRDFLIGNGWLKRVGAQLINEQTLITSRNTPILLTHGDEYCLEDIEYQKFRTMVRSEQWQNQILSLPLEQRITLAEKLRNDSQSMASEKSMGIMDVTQSAIEESLNKHHTCTMIHGHTHRPNTHKKGKNLRCVLGDWDTYVWIATIEDQVYTQFKATPDSFIKSGFPSLEESHKEDLH